jgi:peptidoglycan/xylan/chitin deacetylase (PgdA/CDA1 family)
MGYVGSARAIQNVGRRGSIGKSFVFAFFFLPAVYPQLSKMLLSSYDGASERRMLRQGAASKMSSIYHRSDRRQEPSLRASGMDAAPRSRDHLRRRVQRAVRAAHVALLRRQLPEKVSIYCHAAGGHEQRLAELLGFFCDRGYSFAAPSAFLSNPGKAAFLSFDDNYASWLRLLPIFDRYGTHATFYVNSWPFRDRVGTDDVKRYLAILRSGEETTLSTAELQEIAAAGHVIGAHTRTHPVLTALMPDAAREEIRASKTELESILQRRVEHFAYPFGMRRHFSEPLRSYCRSIGFATIANAIPGLQYARSQPYSLHRSHWMLDQPLAFNLDNLRVDGRLFHLLTGRSAVGGAPDGSD